MDVGKQKKDSETILNRSRIVVRDMVQNDGNGKSPYKNQLLADVS